MLYLQYSSSSPPHEKNVRSTPAAFNQHAQALYLADFRYPTGP
jgi:hypothetical protein